MNYMDKMERIKYINRYLRDFTKDQCNAIDKLSAKISNEAFKDLCEEYEMCYICGKDLDPNGRIIVKEPYPSVMHKEIRTKTCPDTACKYNKRLVNNYEN